MGHFLSSADGTILAGTRNESTILLWDLATLGKVSGLAASGSSLGPAVLQGHSGGIFGLTFGPDGKTLASCALDGTVRFWNVATRKEVGVLGPIPAHSNVAFSPDGNTLVVSSNDGTLRLWHAASFAETDAGAQPASRRSVH